MKLTLRAWRGQKQMTQTELAKAVGKSYATIHNWEQGKTEPRPKDVTALKKAMGLKPTDHIIVGED